MGHFYFVRHGQTVWNVENKICGATDSPLTEHGREQAAETSRNILESGIQAMERIDFAFVGIIFGCAPFLLISLFLNRAMT